MLAPNAKTIGIILSGKNFSIDELDKTARSRVWPKGEPPAGTVRQTMVHIFPQDKTVMCEFTYSAGFGKPFWRVKIGYDGKVLGVKAGVKQEARVPGNLRQLVKSQRFL